jgi:hypothetical protein
MVLGKKWKFTSQVGGLPRASCAGAFCFHSDVINETYTGPHFSVRMSKLQKLLLPRHVVLNAEWIDFRSRNL